MRKIVVCDTAVLQSNLLFGAVWNAYVGRKISDLNPWEGEGPIREREGRRKDVGDDGGRGKWIGWRGALERRRGSRTTY